MLRLLPLLLSLACLAPAFADERADTQRQLEQTQKDIGELKKLLDGIQQEKSGVQKQLKSTETEMGDLEKQIKALQDELDKSEAELKRLDGEKKNSRTRALSNSASSPSRPALPTRADARNT